MATSRTWSRYTVSSIGSMKRKLSRPFRVFTLRAGTFKYSSGSGTSRSPGATQWPTTPGPIMSAMNSYSRPFHENKTGQELPRRSSSVMLCTFFVARFISSCGTPVGHSRRTTSALRSDRALVVIERFEVDAHPVVLIAALIAQNKRPAAELRHDQIRVAISINIRNSNRPRLIQFNRIEIHILGDIGPAFASQISQQSQFPTAARFSRRHQIQPSIILVVQCRESPALRPAQIWERDTFQPFPFDVPPQAETRRARMRERQIHPSVLIKIKRHRTHRRWQFFFAEIDAAEGREFPFARIEIDGCSRLPPRDDEVNRAVIVEIGGDNASSRGRKTERGFRGHIRERAIAIAAPKNIVRRRARCS